MTDIVKTGINLPDGETNKGMHLYLGDKMVGQVKEATITHEGNDKKAPLMGEVVFKYIIGKPSLLDVYILQAGKYKYKFQFVGEKPEGQTLDLTDRNIEKYNYPIETNKKYKFFARLKPKMTRTSRVIVDRAGGIEVKQLYNFNKFTHKIDM